MVLLLKVTVPTTTVVLLLMLQLLNDSGAPVTATGLYTTFAFFCQDSIIAIP